MVKAEENSKFNFAIAFRLNTGYSTLCWSRIDQLIDDGERQFVDEAKTVVLFLGRL